jgi:hypothetical protein
MQCPMCRQTVAAYCTINDRFSACERCANGITQELSNLSFGKVARGAVYGAAVALAITVVAGVALAFGREITPLRWIGSLACLFAGSIVGRAASQGARGSGGTPLRLVAIGLALLAISYTPAIEALFFPVPASEGPEPGFPMRAIVALLAPAVFYLDREPIALIASGYAVYDCWRRTGPPLLDVKGPFSVDGTAPAAAPPPVTDAKAAGLDFERPM